MKKRHFCQEEKLLHHLILHSHDVPTALGLFDGMAGIMLVLAHYSRVRQLSLVECVSDYLMEQITTNMTKSGSLFLGNGMAGIGWAIEYLIQNNYMKGCGADLNRELDECIMNLDVCRIKDMTLDNGLLGLYYYVLAHVQGARKQGKSVFDNAYLKDWIQILQYRYEKFPSEYIWKEMINRLESAINGHSLYKMDLSQFIIPMKRVPLVSLGLQKGLSGYIELQLLNTSYL